MKLWIPPLIAAALFAFGVTLFVFTDRYTQRVVRDGADVPCSTYASWPMKDTPSRCFSDFRGDK